MSFSPLMTLLTAACVDGLAPDPKVLELGNQRFRPGDKALGAVAGRLAGHARVDAAGLAKLRALSKAERLPKTEAFYRALGFSGYTAVDVNDKYGSLIMDLNRDLQAHYGFMDRFDLVTNNGTGEHVFDQHAVFKNIHALCRSGGMMIHVMPFMYYVNHGFYSYHPGLYFDLAAANGYRLCLIGFADRDGRGALARPPATHLEGELAPGGGPILLDEQALSFEEMRGKPEFRSLSLAGRLSLLRRSIEARLLARKRDSQATSQGLTRALARVIARSPTRKLMVFAVLRKQREEAFRAPFQGLYGADIADPQIAKNYTAKSK